MMNAAEFELLMDILSTAKCAQNPGALCSFAVEFFHPADTETSRKLRLAQSFEDFIWCRRRVHPLADGVLNRTDDDMSVGQ